MKPINLTAAILGLLILVALPCAAWNLLAPAGLCWIPAERAAAIGAVATFLMLCIALSDAKASEAAEARGDDETGKLPPND